MARPRQQRQRAKDLTTLDQDQQFQLMHGYHLFTCEPGLTEAEMLAAWRLHRDSLRAEWAAQGNTCPPFMDFALSVMPQFGRKPCDRRAIIRGHQELFAADEDEVDEDL